jgi:hypothetical protein
MANSGRNLFLVLVLCIVSFTVCYSYSFDAYTGMIGEGVLSVAPTATIDFTPETMLFGELIATYGILPFLDVTADLFAADLYPDIGYQYSWIMPRFEFLPGNIIALQISMLYDPLAGSASFELSPQYHLFLENDMFALELNAGATIPLSDPSLTELFAIIAPVYKPIPDILAIYCEIDPSYTLGDPAVFTLKIVPGICITVPDSPHQLSAGLIINDVTSGAPTFGVGIWYAFTVSLIPDSDESESDS